jgi:hypothetical protein
MKFRRQLHAPAGGRPPLDVGRKNQIGKQQKKKEYSHLRHEDIGAMDCPIVSGGANRVIYCCCISAGLIA